MDDAVPRALREMALLLEVDGANRYRARAYERGARAVEALGESFQALVAERRLTQVPGIGPALAATIEELALTGRSATLERLRERVPLSESDEKTRRKIRAALERRAGPPRDEFLLHEVTGEADAALEIIRALPGVDRAEAAGALRRRAESMARLQLIIAGRDGPAVIDRLTRLPQAAAALERADDRLVLRLTRGMILEAVVVPPAAYAVGLHRLTGSPAHLASLEALARERGLVLDGAGLWRRGRRVAVRGEEDLYRHLGLPFIVPEMREDAGEIEAAVAGLLPARLVEVGDIRGLVHCHTTYSDGANSIDEMARAADALGVEYLTITDHSPTASYANGLTVDRLRRQWDEMARVAGECPGALAPRDGIRHLGRRVARLP